MKVKLVGRVEYPCPRFLVRSGQGWQVRIPGERSVYFADGIHGGVSLSHQAAIRSLQAREISVEARLGLGTREFAHKQWPTGTPGIFLFKHVRPGRAVEYQLQVRVPSVPIRVVYVGTERTWESRMEEKMGIAKQLHRDMIEQKATQLVAASSVSPANHISSQFAA